VTKHAWSGQANPRVTFEYSSGWNGLTVTSVAEDKLVWLVAKFRVFVNCVVDFWMQECVLCSLIHIDLFFPQFVKLLFRRCLVLLVDEAAES